MTRKWTAVALGVALAAGACGNSNDNNAAKTVTPEGEVQAMSSADRSVADLAVVALAEHLNVPQANIEVDTERR